MRDQPRSTLILVMLVALTALVVLIGAWEVSTILNDRTQDRRVADRVTAVDVRENRRIIDELVCEVRALREDAERQGLVFPSAPQTLPRQNYEELPCPPQR